MQSDNKLLALNIETIFKFVQKVLIFLYKKILQRNHNRSLERQQLTWTRMFINPWYNPNVKNPLLFSKPPIQAYPIQAFSQFIYFINLI